MGQKNTKRATVRTTPSAFIRRVWGEPVSQKNTARGSSCKNTGSTLHAIFNTCQAKNTSRICRKKLVRVARLADARYDLRSALLQAGFVVGDFRIVQGYGLQIRVRAEHMSHPFIKRLSAGFNGLPVSVKVMR